MKKSLWVLIATLGLIALAAAAFIFRRPGTGSSLPSLRPYVVKERVVYFDPAELFKSMGAPMPMPSGMTDPIMMKVTKISNVSFDQISQLVHHDLTAKDGWHFQPWPPVGIPKTGSLGLNGMIIASKGGTATASGMFGALTAGGADDEIMITPDFSAKDYSLNGGMPVAKNYMIMEDKKLSKWEVTWLKITHLGKNPFSSEKDLESFGQDL